jgi:hypothetical protein
VKKEIIQKISIIYYTYGIIMTYWEWWESWGGASFSPTNFIIFSWRNVWNFLCFF